MDEQASQAVPNEALRARLETLSGRYPSMDVEAMADVVRAVLLTVTGDLSTRETALLAEVEALGLTIVSAKAEIAAMRVEEINDLHIPTATDELDEIVQHTAAATNTILEACETLDTVQEKLDGEPALALQHATTRIYEACSFQDITGQRITKIVTALHAIESRITHIVRAFGASDGLPAAPAGEPETLSLTNGPQLPAQAMGQSDIDALLDSFD